MKRRKAILYIRVSTDEQAEKGHSLAHQEEMLRRHCAANNIEIVAFFKEDYSAKTFERPQFKKLLEFQRKNKAIADLLLFLKWDRFSRNAPEAYTMISKLHSLGLEPQAIEQPLNMEIPEQKFLLALYLTAPEVENDRRSMNILAGVRKAMKEGRYMGSAPYGYKHGRTENNKPTIVPSKDKAMVVQSFEMMATGLYQIEELRRMLNKKGMPLGRTRFWYMMRNPTYIGKVFVAAHKNEPASLVKGVHEAIVPESLFYEVQDILDGRKKKEQPITICQKDELPLRGFLQCARCGKPLTGSASKGRSARYYYYHCKFGCKERFRADEANSLFNDVLHAVSNNDKVYRSLELILGGENKEEAEIRAKELAELKNKLETFEQRMERAQVLMLDGKMDFVDYQPIKAKLEEDAYRLKLKIDAIEELQPKDENDVMEFGFHFLSNLDKLFTSAALEVKQQIIGSTFPEKLIYENNQFRTASDNNVLLLIAASSKTFAVKKESRLEFSNLLSRRVEPAGFEPASKHMPNKLSTCVFLNLISEECRNGTNLQTSYLLNIAPA